MADYNVEQLKRSFGTVKLLKGTKLYYFGKNLYNCLFTLSDELFLRTYLHPSDKPCKVSRDVVTVIELQRDVTLIFMISSIQSSYIRAYLNLYLDISNLEELKPQPEDTERILKDHKLIEAWQSEGFDGWISSVNGENRNLDVVLFNNSEVFKVIDSKPIIFDWSNWYIKTWGTAYPVSIIQYPPEMTLNVRYKNQFEAYQDYMKDNPNGTTLCILLNNATIHYIDTPYIPVICSSIIVEDVPL
jgi:hypothetical protein